MTFLHRSPFALLNVSLHDSRARIQAAAEERSLEMDEELCRSAQAALVQARLRLKEEISWLPGIEHREAMELLSKLRHTEDVPEDPAWPLLSRLNLRAARLEIRGSSFDLDELLRQSCELAEAADELDAEELLAQINADREAARFPLVSSADAIEEALREAKRRFTQILRDVLDERPSREIVGFMTRAAARCTNNGRRLAPSLIDNLLDIYELEAQPFFEKETGNIQRHIERVKMVTLLVGSALSGRGLSQFTVGLLSLDIDRLEKLTRNWDFVAQPLQLNAQAKGSGHAPSRRLGYEIRSFALLLNNEHGLSSHALRVTRLILQVFPEVLDLKERAQEDLRVLNRLLS